MASTFTPLGVELQATGENAGTWGTKTNTNLSLISQLVSGYNSQSIAGGSQTTALTIVDGNTTGTAQHRMIEFTGSITGNQIVTIPLDVETFYILKNSTTNGAGTPTVEFKYASGSGDSVTFAGTDKGTKIVFASANDGTNPDMIEVPLGISNVVEDTTPQLGGDLDMNGQDIVTTSNANIDLNPNGSGVVNLVGNSTRAATLRFAEDTDDGSNYIELKAGTIGSNLSFTLPTSDATSSGQALVSNGSGVLSFADAGITTGKAIAMAIVFG
jgi:hypothetical protein|tara:strand:+ start:159 stop:971 length:813 start_codon:yes stop_codon:yes gene_type:complete